MHGRTHPLAPEPLGCAVLLGPSSLSPAWRNPSQKDGEPPSLWRNGGWVLGADDEVGLLSLTFKSNTRVAILLPTGPPCRAAVTTVYMGVGRPEVTCVEAQGLALSLPSWWCRHGCWWWGWGRIGNGIRCRRKGGTLAAGSVARAWETGGGRDWAGRACPGVEGGSVG